MMKSLHLAEEISDMDDTTQNELLDKKEELLNLQKRYRNGDIKIEDLTEEQIISLIALYDKQNAYLKKDIEIRKQKLLKVRKKLHSKK